MITFKRFFITIAMVTALQTAWAQKVMLHLADNQVAEISTTRLDSITFAAEGDSLMSSSVLNNSIFIGRGQKILLAGASFANSDNGWDKILQDITGIEVINNAIGGTHINSYTTARLLNANSALPHGSLFLRDGKDIFDDIGAVIIMYTHNYNVLLDEEAYMTRTPSWYKDNYKNSNGTAINKQSGEVIDYASAWDYLIKQLKEWNPDIQILICSHWLPSRTIYNASSRMLALRHDVSYCPLDVELGFTPEELVRIATGIDGRPEPTEGNYNRSVLHSQFVAVDASGNPIGKTERIDGKVWGWHPAIVNESIDYGCGTMIDRDGKTVYVPWIQKAIASTVAKSIIAVASRNSNSNSQKSHP